MKTLFTKLLRTIKSYIYASSHTKKGEFVRLFLCGTMGLLLGVGMALMMQAHYEEVDKEEALYTQMLQSATPPRGGEKRWLALEQLKLFLK